MNDSNDERTREVILKDNREIVLLSSIDDLNRALDKIRPVLENLVERGTMDGFDELAIIQRIQIATSFVINTVHLNNPLSKEFV